MKTGSGEFTVNGKPFAEYFGRKTLQMVVMQPLETVGQKEKVDIFVNVKGGGPSGQAGAVQHGISRALLKVSDTFRAKLKPEGFLTRDARAVERKKYGRHKARKRPQYSKR
ncbi:MAG: 30S ribosomal protein S9 [Oligoflexia bacterium]|nr:30S ribosomal protein S9 [Oligoflexia bacterium]